MWPRGVAWASVTLPTPTPALSASEEYRDRRFDGALAQTPDSMLRARIAAGELAEAASKVIVRTNQGTLLRLASTVRRSAGGGPRGGSFGHGDGPEMVIYPTAPTRGAPGGIGLG